MIFFYLIVITVLFSNCSQRRPLVRESDELRMLGKKKASTPTKTKTRKTEEIPSQKTPIPLTTMIVQPTLENLSKLSDYTMSCDSRTVNLDETITEIAADLESQKLLYNSKPFTDCSGIFHRVLREIKKKCPDYDVPDAEQYRDTRELARWYFNQGELIVIEDPFAAADLIKPGAVLFFGYRDKKYKNINPTALFGSAGIEHMGVVVDVQRDKYQRVIGYGLFHGQTTGKIASITRFHLRTPTRPNLPPFGNWNQQWVAFARIVKPVPELISHKR
jgi:hypothetical protein